MMKNYLIVGIIIASLSVYFLMTLVVFPQEYLTQKVIEPQPTQSITFAEDEINLGESFVLQIQVENKNDVADILITSVAFPGFDTIGDKTEIVSYDFTQSPRYIEIGDMIGTDYTFGGQMGAAYPSIEAYSRNVPENTVYNMALEITPQESGIFETYIKTIAIPHTTELAHVPNDGFLDPQNEYVTVIQVTVNP